MRTWMRRRWKLPGGEGFDEDEDYLNGKDLLSR